MTYFMSERVAAPPPDMPFGYTYDAQGRVLTYRSEVGFWHKYTYTPEGHKLTYAGGNGLDMIALAHPDKSILWYDKPTRTYRTIGHRLLRAEALAHWGAPRGDNPERAEVFINAINSFEEPQ